jgi:hypothetical protein
MFAEHGKSDLRAHIAVLIIPIVMLLVIVAVPAIFVGVKRWAIKVSPPRSASTLRLLHMYEMTSHPMQLT